MTVERKRVASLGLGFAAPPLFAIITSIEALVLAAIPTPSPCSSSQYQAGAAGSLTAAWNTFKDLNDLPSRLSRLRAINAAKSLLAHYLVSELLL